MTAPIEFSRYISVEAFYVFFSLRTCEVNLPRVKRLASITRLYLLITAEAPAAASLPFISVSLSTEPTSSSWISTDELILYFNRDGRTELSRFLRSRSSSLPVYMTPVGVCMGQFVSKAGVVDSNGLKQRYSSMSISSSILSLSSRQVADIVLPTCITSLMKLLKVITVLC